MGRLPNIENITVAPEKLTVYLLNPAHNENGGKAWFFEHFGFSVAQWEILADSFIYHAHDHEITKQEWTKFGTRYVIEGSMPTPVKREIFVRVIWFMRTNEQIPRFVTAYPLDEEDFT